MKCKRCGTENDEGHNFCGICGTPLTTPRNVQYSPLPIQPAPNSANRTRLGIILIVAIFSIACVAILGISFLVVATGGIDLPSALELAPAESNAQSVCVQEFKKPVQFGYRCVEYIVESDGFPSVTYANYQGGTEQLSGYQPFGDLYIFTASPGQFVYISTQASDGTRVSCTIKVDGEVFKHSESLGRYTIASCSGRLP